MGKSYRKHKIFGNCAGSEKKDKQLCNRKIRHRVKQQLQHGDFDDPMPLPNEVHNVWSMTKDGKHYFGDATDADMRK